MSDGPSALVDFIAGTSAGLAGLIAGHPFDTIKTRLQAQPNESISSASSSTNAIDARRTPLLSGPGTGPATAPAPISTATSGTRHYRSAMDAFRIIVREEKILGLYKGVTSPMLGVAIMNASIFGVYGLALRVQMGGSSTSSPGSDPGPGLSNSGPTLTQIMIAGISSGIVSAVITSPIELIKIREQLDAASNRQKSTWAVARDIWKKGGLRGMYRGLGSTCVRDLGYGPYFFTYEVLNRWLLSRYPADLSSGSASGKSLSALELALSGGLAGVVAWVSTFWADVIKTRVQASEAPPAPTHGMSSGGVWSRPGFAQTARETWREGGMGAFWKGIGPTVLRALPVNAVMFIVFEAIKDDLTARNF